MNNLRIAAQQALEALDEIEDLWGFVPRRSIPKRMKAQRDLRAALAQPEPQPVAWRTFDGEDGYLYMPYEDNETYAAEWAQRNPRRADWVEPLYTAPLQRPEPIIDKSMAVRIATQLGWVPPPQEPDTDCHEQGICQRSGYSFGAQPATE